MGVKMKHDEWYEEWATEKHGPTKFLRDRSICAKESSKATWDYLHEKLGPSTTVDLKSDGRLRKENTALYKLVNDFVEHANGRMKSEKLQKKIAKFKKLAEELRTEEVEEKKAMIAHPPEEEYEERAFWDADANGGRGKEVMRKVRKRTWPSPGEKMTEDGLREIIRRLTDGSSGPGGYGGSR
jgi:hypothetical protein